MDLKIEASTICLSFSLLIIKEAKLLDTAFMVMYKFWHSSRSLHQDSYFILLIIYFFYFKILSKK